MKDSRINSTRDYQAEFDRFDAYFSTLNQTAR